MHLMHKIITEFQEMKFNCEHFLEIDIFLFSASVTVTENDSKKGRLTDGNWATDNYWYTSKKEKM